jgi:hypothetical protein
VDSLPLVGRDGVGVVRCGTSVPHGTTPTPDPSPQGGGEKSAASSRHILTPYFAATGVAMRTRSFMMAAKGASLGAS